MTHGEREGRCRNGRGGRRRRGRERGGGRYIDWPCAIPPSKIWELSRREQGEKMRQTGANDGDDCAVGRARALG